ncbi:putative alkaline shock family protein YloU [Sinobaca qinghaiensis]|uniref:Alkaline shock protein 23 n=1 Tax=Sinobaca qinghaiensis TaxID=342944 RepID=A0A419V7U7_9BACL|nr:Asp23/Gls24 family envelope stress response protein [Sinobaca qinghaiensis]RKD76132.1 putative alkaline shock family protein YloU [Sinobaca qinghaiensis]
MAEINNQNNQEEKELQFSNEVIKKIAALSASEVEGILSLSGGVAEGFAERLGRKSLTKGVSAETGEKQAAIELNVIAKYGANVPQVFQEVKRRITENVRQMTGLEVVEVKMFVDDVDVEGDRKLGEEPEAQETTGRLE